MNHDTGKTLNQFKPNTNSASPTTMKTIYTQSHNVRLTGLILGTLLVIFIMSVSTVSAQNKKMTKTRANPEMRAENAVAYWNKQLNLSEEQKGQFKTLLAEEFAKRDSVQSVVKNRNEQHAAFTKLRDETHARMETILTPEQHQKFVAMREEAMKGKSGVQKMKKATKSMKMKPSKTPADTSGSN